MSRIVLYGDVNPNLIDGSSIWLSSITEVVAGVVDEIHVFLKARVTDPTLTGHLRNVPAVYLHEPRGEGQILTPAQAADTVRRFVEKNPVDAVITRGLEACTAFASHTVIAQRLWSYITDLPFPPSKAEAGRIAKVDEVARRSRRMLAQTESARAYLESLVPSAAGKTIVTPPMIPPASMAAEPTRLGPVGTAEHPLRLVYAGKMADEWKTQEMLDLPAALRELGISATLDVAGAKINAKKGDPKWAGQMLAALERYDRDSDSGVTWHGSLTRDDAIKLIQRAQLGIGWRKAKLDSSLEISTKALEYGLNGAVPVVNRTRDHIDLFGKQYPFYTSANASAAELADTIQRGLPLLDQAAKNALDAASDYTFAKVAERFQQHFLRAGVGANRSECKATANLLVASHDLKFMGELIDRWTLNPSLNLRIDGWNSLHDHDEHASSREAAWADVVVCEWAGPNLVWYSNHKAPGQRLVSRLHRFELGGQWMGNVNWDQVDEVVFVSEFIRDLAVGQLDLPKSRTRIIPNSIDTIDLGRVKERGSQFHLGLIGMVPFLKRPDLALDLLERLLKEDSRYQLHIKGRMPWDYPYEWNNSVQKQRYLAFFNRIGSDPGLKNAVKFEPFSPNMGNWLRRVGFVLSPSDLESFHLAPAEGMASGSVPVIRQRPGASEIFGELNVFSTLDAAADRILSLRPNVEFERCSEEARHYAQRWDIEKTASAWDEVIMGYAKRGH